MLQLIKILTRIKNERRWVRRFLAGNPVSAVVSDNRYGFYCPGTPSVFITHQLKPGTSLGGLVDAFAQRFLYRYINQFSVCWVPDNSGPHGLAGALSHPRFMPQIPVKYIGTLSRLNVITEAEMRYDVLFILSGPEPQRSLFESVVIHQLKKNTFKCIVVRGLPEVNELPEAIADVQFYNHVNADELTRLIYQSKYVVSRSGYTSVMDMMKLKKKMIVVPTPAQPEQQYLARHLQKNNMAVAAQQSRFHLSKLIAKAERFDFRFPESHEQYKEAVAEFMQEYIYRTASE